MYSLFFSGAVAYAQGAEDKARELSVLQTRIKSLQQEKESTHQKKTDTETRLANIEHEVSISGKQLRQIRRELDRQTVQRDKLRKQRTEQQQQIRLQRKQLANEARAAYLMGHQQHVKLLLNQDRPEVLGRVVNYLGYFSRARARKITAMKTHIVRIQALESSISQKTATLQKLATEQQQRMRILSEQQALRKSLLVKLHQDLASQGQELSQLKANERQLQNLMSSLLNLLADIPPDSGSQQSFLSRRGQLLWPANGRLAARFGTARESAGLTWRGVFIETLQGGDVRVVSQGRVAFSDWLRGFGLLLIVDHGDGYMSLYGHNQVLYKEVGEWVDTNETIASSGGGDGSERAGLYFELRHKGRPINPVRWCSGMPLPRT